MKNFLLAAILAGAVVLPAANVLAQATTETPPLGPTSVEEVLAIIDTITMWLFSIVMALALVFLLISAFYFLTSGGDPGKVSTARSALTYALIGVAVALIARGLIFVVRILLNVAP